MSGLRVCKCTQNTPNFVFDTYLINICVNVSQDLALRSTYSYRWLRPRYSRSAMLK